MSDEFKTPPVESPPVESLDDDTDDSITVNGITVPIKVARKSELLKTMIDSSIGHDNLQINVENICLNKILKWLALLVEGQPTSIPTPLPNNNLGSVLTAWEQDYLDSLNQDSPYHEMLCNILTAANYMDIPSLVKLCSAKVASMLAGKSPEEIRSTFNIENDFTPEEEAATRAVNEDLGNYN